MDVTVDYVLTDENLVDHVTEELTREKVQASYNIRLYR